MYRPSEEIGNVRETAGWDASEGPVLSRQCLVLNLLLEYGGKTRDLLTFKTHDRAPNSLR